jgi:hypothetical protein
MTLVSTTLGHGRTGVDVFYEAGEVAEDNAAVVPEACHRVQPCCLPMFSN